jgi:putative holliday junction resolvase
MKFSQIISEKVNIPIMLWDERMSTVTAERALIGLDVSRSKRKEQIDAHAAAIILQSFFDHLRNAHSRA